MTRTSGTGAFHSGHAVRELTRPEGVLRMLFTAVIQRPPSPATRLRSRLFRIASGVRQLSRRTHFRAIHWTKVEEFVSDPPCR